MQDTCLTECTSLSRHITEILLPYWELPWEELAAAELASCPHDFRTTPVLLPGLTSVHSVLGRNKPMWRLWELYSLWHGLPIYGQWSPGFLWCASLDDGQGWTTHMANNWPMVRLWRCSSFFLQDLLVVSKSPVDVVCATGTTTTTTWCCKMDFSHTLWLSLWCFVSLLEERDAEGIPSTYYALWHHRVLTVTVPYKLVVLGIWSDTRMDMIHISTLP